MNKMTMEIRALCYAYTPNLHLLRDISYVFEGGKAYAILGPSGCGKTTLLSLLGGLDSPTNGTILVNGEDIAKKGLAYHRQKRISFVFQNYNLIDYLTPMENVQLTSSVPPLPVLEKVGLDKDMCRRSVLKLSGGQQQRVAIARALASDSGILLADEPTGNLDADTSQGVIDLLLDSAHGDSAKCVIVVTHSTDLADRMDVRLCLRNGKLENIA